MVREAVTSFRPDVFLVDNFPLGSRRELVDTLEELRGSGTKTVLGLRDILDTPAAVCADWDRQGIRDVLDLHYDRILVYGSPDILDVVEAYRLPPAVAGKTHYCGYVTALDPPPRPAGEIRADLGFPEPYLLATGGGGGDAYPLLEEFLAALRHMPDRAAAVITGPLMNESQRGELRRALDGRPHVVLRDHAPDLRSYIAAAEVVVSMCGYNTAAEIAALGAKAVAVPRTWRYGEHERGTEAGVEGEQRIRAEALARLGILTYLEPESLNPQALADRIESTWNSNSSRNGNERLDLGGVTAVAEHLLALAGANTGAKHA